MLLEPDQVRVQPSHCHFFIADVENFPAVLALFSIRQKVFLSTSAVSTACFIWSSLYSLSKTFSCWLKAFFAWLCLIFHILEEYLGLPAETHSLNLRIFSLFRSSNLLHQKGFWCFLNLDLGITPSASLIDSTSWSKTSSINTGPGVCVLQELKKNCPDAP